MYPLKLKVQPQAWQLYATRKADPAFRVFSDKVYQRDNHTCQFCGFQAQDRLEVTNLDANYRNNKLSNLVTTCPLCAQCQFIESIHLQNEGGGTLVHLPEMTQANLNSLCHVLFCAMGNDTAYKAIAQSVYRSLKMRAQGLEKKYGEGTSNPGTLGQLIAEAQIEAPDMKSEAILEDVRLLPSHAKFRKLVDHWLKTAE